MKKKLIAHAAAIALFFTTAFCGIGAPVHAAEASESDSIKPVSQDLTFYKDSETGHIYTTDIDPGYTGNSSSDGPSPSRAYIPSAWPTSADGGSGGVSEIKSTYPATRSQSPYGTCWAFAATASAEFDMITDGHKSKSNTDFSEFQMVYFNTHTANDKFGGLDGDTVTTSGYDTINYNYQTMTVPRYLTVGGNYIYAMHTAAQWKTFTTESNLPYSKVISSPSYAPAASYASADQAKLTDIRFLDIKNDRNGVKQAIMNNGAVLISYNSNDSYYSNNSGVTLYYNPYSQNTNHDVVIVGWDDSISRYSFPEGRRPEGDGAWLVRNSWSTNNSSSSSSTYFYMSYYDKALAATAYSSEYAPSSQYQYLYQHDGSISHGTLSTKGIANVFTAKGPDSAVSEELKAVMLSLTSQTNVNYKVEVYTGWQSPTNPGQLHTNATTTGWTDKKGIYTIPLKASVPLAPGEKYAVVVTALNGPLKFDLENTTNRYYTDENNTEQHWFSAAASLDAGESFIVNGGVWTDIYSKGWYKSDQGGYGNVCLKAMTNKSSVKKYTATYNLNGGVNSTANPSGFLSTQSGGFTLKAPTRSGYHFLGWYSDSACTKKVTKINYDTKANQTFYAKWCSNSNKTTTQITKKATAKANGSYNVNCSVCGQVRKTYTTYPATSVKLNTTSPVYTGSNVSPYPVIKDSKGNKLVNGTDYTYKYNKSTRKKTGRYYVTVTFKGKYNIASKKLYFTIVPKAPSSASAKLYGYDDVKVSWSKCTGASGYYVYYKASSASKYSKYKTTTKNYVNFSNLSDNVKYNFRVIPYYKSGDKKYKSSKYKTVSATTLKKLAQPSMKKVSGGRVSLNWKTASGASGYQVYWASSKKGKYKKLCDYSKAYIGVTFSVGKGQTYYYKVRAYQKVGKKKIYGPFSTPKAFKR